MNAITNWALGWAARAAVVLVMASAGTFSTAAAELLMFEREGCIWCARWNSEIAPVYPKSAEGQAAPLRRIDLVRTVGSDGILARPVRYTPTFVLIDQGREVGRITGYVSDDAFWGLLSNMLSSIRKDRDEAVLSSTME